jgi:hypothetical protein
MSTATTAVTAGNPFPVETDSMARRTRRATQATAHARVAQQVQRAPRAIALRVRLERPSLVRPQHLRFKILPLVCII